MYHDSKPFAILAAPFILIVGLGVLQLLFAAGKKDNAIEHAENLELKNYKVHCDNTP